MSRPHVRVRTYDAAGLDASTRLAMLVTAAEILKRAGIAVTWISCDEPDPTQAADVCVPALGRAELAVRLVRLPAVDQAIHTSRLPLGYSLVDPQVRAGSLATIYVDRVERLAAESAHCGVLLGRAVAHEIGHLLLGTSAHARSGLMKAVWSREVLTREQANDWVFTADDARAMRDKVRQRAIQQLAGLSEALR